MAIANNGTFNVNAGTQTVGAITGSGSLNVTEGGINPTVVNTPSIVQNAASVASGATLNITGPGTYAKNLVLANAGTVNVTGGTGQTVLDITGTGNLSIGTGAKLALSAASSAAMSTADGLTIAANGDFDVGASGIVLSNTTSASIANLQNDIVASYNRGKYSGTLGITSTAAATYDTSKQQTAIGMYYNSRERNYYDRRRCSWRSHPGWFR